MPRWVYAIYPWEEDPNMQIFSFSKVRGGIEWD
jgi:hypothetical protein